MAYKVHTSSRAIASSTMEIDGKKVWFVYDAALEHGTWAIFNGQIKVKGPFKHSDGMADDIRAAWRLLPSLDEPEEVAPDPPVPIPATVEPAQTQAVAPSPPLVDSISVTDEETGEIVIVTDELRLEARSIHEDVILHGQQSALHMFEFGRKLKELRDRSLHLALGFTSFGAYCDAIKLSRSIATERIAAVEELRELQESGSIRPVELPGYMNMVLLSRANPADVKTVVAQNDVADMTKRKLDDALKRAERDRKQAEELTRQLAIVEERFRELQTQTPTVIEKPVEVQVRDPAQQQELDKARGDLAAREQTIEQLGKKLAQVQKWYEEISKDLTDLRARADRNYDLDQQIIVKEHRAKELEDLITQMQSVFNDGHRKVRNGPVLMRLLAPLDRITYDIAREVATLRKEGVGGPAEDLDITKLSKLLRQMAADLDAIVKDRKTITVDAQFKEVPEHE